jgi:hypothetical protein
MTRPDYHDVVGLLRQWRALANRGNRAIERL